ncbi:MAG: hypothetical protein PHH14_06330 [Candidatus Margulisbacteria bacterium]|nr:hypothetical protein [Candidatus Margulisiibacteriota bacterium]
MNVKNKVITTIYSCPLTNRLANWYGSQRQKLGVNYLLFTTRIAHGCKSEMLQASTPAEKDEVRRQTSFYRSIGNQYSSSSLKLLKAFARGGLNLKKLDSFIDRANALKYLFAAKPDLVPEIQTALFRNSPLGQVVFGLKTAALVENNFSEKYFQDLEYLLSAFNLMIGEKIQLLRLRDGRLYVYDQNILRSKALVGDFRFAVTRTGLELLIQRDLAARRGVYFDQLAQPSVDAENFGELFQILNRPGTRLSAWQRPDLDKLYLVTYQRPKALDRALTRQQEVMALYGHHLPVFIIDDTQEPAQSQGNGPTADDTRAVVEQFRQKGMGLEYLSREQKEKLISACIEQLQELYSRQLADGELDERVKREVVLAGDQGQIDKNKIAAIVKESFRDNIAGARNVSIALGQNEKMGCFDDDSFPFVVTLKRQCRDEIVAEREEKFYLLFKKMIDKLYAALPAARNFDDILVNHWDKHLVQAILRKYYAYDPKADSGLLPRARGEIISPDIEHRLRFDNILQARLPRNLVATEDGVAIDIDEAEEKLERLPQMTWKIAAGALGKPLDQLPAYLGARNDLRGIGIEPMPSAPDWGGRLVGGVTTHFSGDRDWSASSLLNGILSKGGKAFYFNRVTVKTGHLGLLGSRQAGFAMFCFNTTTLDHTRDRGFYPVPTPAAWARLEEPFYYTSLKGAIDGTTMAWSAATGGHDRLPGERRPKLAKQMKWEMSAEIAWRIYEKAVAKMNVQAGAPAEKLKALGGILLALAEEFSFTDEQMNAIGLIRQKFTEIRSELEQKLAQSTDDTERNELKLLIGEIAEEGRLRGGESAADLQADIKNIIMKIMVDDGRIFILWDDLLRAVESVRHK